MKTKCFGFVVIAIFSALVGACSNDSNTAAAPTSPPTPTPKPLPECTTPVDLMTAWNSKGVVVEHKFSIGFRSYSFFETQNLPGNQTSLTYPLPTRGQTYFVQIQRTTISGEIETRYHNFYLPTCEQRVEWQKTNPGYVEPLDITLLF
jgi:hypothetical protein